MGAVWEDAAWRLCRWQADAPPAAGGSAEEEQHEELAACGRCRRWASTSEGLRGGQDEGGRWFCADCLLAREVASNPFDALDSPPERWLSVAALFARRPLGASAAGGEGGHGPDAAGPGYYAFSDRITVFWDGLDRRAYGFACALWHGFPALCSLVNVRSHVELERGLARFPALPRAGLLRCGGVSAALPGGVYILDCEKYPQVLLYELQYRHTVRPPPLEARRAYEQQFLEPLAQLRAACASGTTDGRPRWWWDCKEGLRLIARSMAQCRCCIVDGFLPEEDYQEAARSMRDFHRGGHLTPGTIYYKLRQKHARQEGGPDLLSDQAQPLKWNMRTESLIYCSDGDPRAPSLARLGAASDAVIAALRLGGPEGDAECIRRLGHTDFREPHLCACYPGGSRGRHARHIDNDSEWLHRTITAIIYFNDGWQKENGGEFRLFTAGHNSTAAAFDILPVRNRMIFFWATEDCPHEVLHCNRDRLAISLIYVDGRASVVDPSGQGRLRVLKELIPVVPLTREEALLRAAGGDRTVWRQLIAQAQAAQGLIVATVQAPVPCQQCGAVSSEGAAGNGPYAGWYCQRCWRAWEAGSA